MPEKWLDRQRMTANLAANDSNDHDVEAQKVDRLDLSSILSLQPGRMHHLKFRRIVNLWP